jgi:hypothetical protein
MQILLRVKRYLTEQSGLIGVGWVVIGWVGMEFAIWEFKNKKKIYPVSDSNGYHNL